MDRRCAGRRVGRQEGQIEGGAGGWSAGRSVGGAAGRRGGWRVGRRAGGVVRRLAGRQAGRLTLGATAPGVSWSEGRKGREHGRVAGRLDGGQDGRAARREGRQDGGAVRRKVGRPDGGRKVGGQVGDTVGRWEGRRERRTERGARRDLRSPRYSAPRSQAMLVGSQSGVAKHAATRPGSRPPRARRPSTLGSRSGCSTHEGIVASGHSPTPRVARPRISSSARNCGGQFCAATKSRTRETIAVGQLTATAGSHRARLIEIHASPR